MQGKNIKCCSADTTPTSATHHPLWLTGSLQGMTQGSKWVRGGEWQEKEWQERVAGYQVMKEVKWWWWWYGSDRSLYEIMMQSWYIVHKCHVDIDRKLVIVRGREISYCGDIEIQEANVVKWSSRQCLLGHQWERVRTWAVEISHDHWRGWCCLQWAVAWPL